MILGRGLEIPVHYPAVALTEAHDRPMVGLGSEWPALKAESLE